MSDMNNRRFFALIVVSAAFYFFVLPYAIGLSARVLPLPGGSLLQSQLSHFAVVFICALPIAMVARWLEPARASRIAIAAALPVSIVAMMALQRAPTGSLALSLLLDFAKVFLMPWLIVRALQWLAPSNQPVEPTR